MQEWKFILDADLTFKFSETDPKILKISRGGNTFSGDLTKNTYEIWQLVEENVKKIAIRIANDKAAPQNNFEILGNMGISASLESNEESHFVVIGADDFDIGGGNHSKTQAKLHFYITNDGREAKRRFRLSAVKRDGELFYQAETFHWIN